MTNLEKVIETDKERFIEAIAKSICINAKTHKVCLVQPPLCGECMFSEKKYKGYKCCTDEIMAWLKAEVGDENWGI